MFARKSLILFLSNLVISGLNSLIFIFAVRNFSEVQFGYLSVASSLFNIFLFFSDLGFMDFHVKKLSEDENEESEFFTFYILFKICIIPILTIVFFFIILIQINRDIIENVTSQKYILLIMFGWVIFSSLNNVYTANLQSKKKVVKMQLAIMIGHIIRLITCIFAFIFNNFYIYVGSLLLGQIVTIILNLYLNQKLELRKPHFKSLKSYIKSGLKYSIPFSINTLVFNLGALFYLRIYDSDSLGVYYVMINTIIILKLIENAAKSMLIPTITPLINDGFDKLKAMILKYEKYMILISVVIIVNALLVGELLLNLIYDQFYTTNGYQFFKFSIIYTLSWGIYIPFHVLHFIYENTTILTIAELIKLVFSMISWIFLIPVWGIIGIDFGIWMALIPNSILLRYYFNKKYNFRGLSQKTIYLLAYSSILIALSFILKIFVVSTALLIILDIVLMIVLFIILYFARIIVKDDFLFFMKTLNIKQLFNHIKGEISYK